MDARRNAEPHVSGNAEEQVHRVRPFQPAARRLQPCGATNSPEAGVYFTHRPEYLLQATWTNPVTNKLLFEGGFTFYNERWIFGPEPYHINGYGPDAVISKTETNPGILYGAANVFTTAGNHQYNMRWATNYVTGSHAFKVGITDMWGTRHYQYDTNQSYVDVHQRRPSQITEYARPLIDPEHLKAALGPTRRIAGRSSA